MTNTTQVHSYVRVTNGVAHEVSAHTRGVGSDYTRSTRDQVAPSRTPEQLKALRNKFPRPYSR